MRKSAAATTVLIADAHPAFCYGLHHALEAEADFQVVTEVSDGAAALAGLRRYRPDVAVLDIEMPQLDGFRVAAAAQVEGLTSKIVLFSNSKQVSFLKKAVRLNVQGYIFKESAISEIVTGLRAVSQGLRYFSSAAMTHLTYSGGSAHQALNLVAEAGFTHLTPTERTILKLLAECCTTKEIAAQLLVSPRTVETHRANICHKLGLRGNHALTKFALAQREQL